MKNPICPGCAARVTGTRMAFAVTGNPTALPPILARWLPRESSITTRHENFALQVSLMERSPGASALRVQRWVWSVILNVGRDNRPTIVSGRGQVSARHAASKQREPAHYSMNARTVPISDSPRSRMAWRTAPRARTGNHSTSSPRAPTSTARFAESVELAEPLGGATGDSAIVHTRTWLVALARLSLPRCAREF